MLASKTKSRIIWAFLSVLAIGLWINEVGNDATKWVRTTFFEVKQSERIPVYQKFYRVKVNVTVDKKEPVLVDFVLGCRTRLRVPKSDWSMIRYVRVPLVFGARTKGGQGVLVEGPRICNADLKKNVPHNYLPAIFFAPDADDLEHMTAYLTERAYDQPVSRLTFQKATIEEVDKQYFENWKATATANIVPLARNGMKSFFHGGNYPVEDPRSRSSVACEYVYRVPIPDNLKPVIRSWWPKDRPKFWVPKAENIDELIQLQKKAGVEKSKVWTKRYKSRLAKYGRTNENYRGSLVTAGGANKWGLGIRRPGGGGALLSQYARTGIIGLIPYSTNLAEPPYELNEPVNEVRFNLDVKNGADQGFAACRRGASISKLKYTKPANKIYLVDGVKVGEVSTNYLMRLNLSLVEEDKFFFKRGHYGLYNTEFGEQQ